MNQPSRNTLNNFLFLLTKVEKMEEISSLVSKVVDGKISICFPVRYNQRNNIHFLIETQRKIDLWDLAQLSIAIKDSLGFDYTEENEDFNIIVELKKLFDIDKIPQLFEDITLYTKENAINVHKFLEKKYPQFIRPIEIVSTAKNNAANQFWQPVHTVSLKRNEEIPNTLSRGELLADKLFQEYGTEIQSLSQSEKEQFIKYLCKMLGFEVIIKASPEHRI